jgi:hypothetical protein
MAAIDRASISETFADTAGQLWDPVLERAEASGELRPGLDRSDVHLWLSHVGFTVVSMLDSKPNWKRADYLQFLRTFVVPAFLGPGSKGGATAQPTDAGTVV